MSKFRRTLLKSINTEASWYRLCPGGIYTKTSAYIDTLFKNFSSTRMELVADSKVLVDNYSKARKVCGADVPSTSYHMITYWNNSSSYYFRNMYVGARNSNNSSWVKPMVSLQPFLNKKVRFTQVPNKSSSGSSYIQIYNNDELGNKVYFGYSVEDGSFPGNCSCSILIFDRNQNGNPEGDSANDLAIYKVMIKYDGILRHKFEACQLTSNIPANLASDNKPHSKGEFGMYDEVTGIFFGNKRANSYFLENFE